MVEVVAAAVTVAVTAEAEPAVADPIPLLTERGMEKVMAQVRAEEV